MTIVDWKAIKEFDLELYNSLQTLRVRQAENLKKFNKETRRLTKQANAIPVYHFNLQYNFKWAK